MMGIPRINRPVILFTGWLACNDTKIIRKVNFPAVDLLNQDGPENTLDIECDN